MLPNFNFQKYKDFYMTHGRTVDQMNKPKSSLNEEQLEAKYRKYQKKLQKQEDKIQEQRQKAFEKKIYNTDEKWQKVKEQVESRDKGQCMLSNKLSYEEKKIIYKEMGAFLFNAPNDPAHVFGKGAYPHMKYDVDNIVTLNRVFHSRLDHYFHPLTGKSINKNEHEMWWRRIVGNKLYDTLLERSKKVNG